MTKMTFTLKQYAAVALFTAMTFIANANGAMLLDSGQNGSGVGNLNPGGKALAFTMGDDAFTLDSVQFRLRTGDTAPLTTTFAIYESTTSGTIRPSTLGVELSDPALVINTTQSYTLTPTSSFTLQANTTYWIVAFSAATNEGFGWAFDNPDSVATTNGVTVPATSGSNPAAGRFYQFNNSSNIVTDPATWTGLSSITNDVVVNGTLIPEPTTLALMGLAGLCFSRRRTQ